MELWKEIPGYEGLYEASTEGRVRSLPRETVHYTGKRIVRGGRVLNGCTTPTGYIQVSMSKDGRTSGARVHTLVALAFIGPRPPRLVVRHLDGNGKNNTVANLAYGTPQDNSDDMDKHGTVLRGERHGCAKLNAEQVAKIREMAKYRSRISLAQLFDMSDQQISNIVLGHQWKS
jgi:hypothetical protein